MIKKKQLTDKQKALRTCNLGTMTPSQKTVMIKNALRKLSLYWKPIAQCRKNAKIRRVTIQMDSMYHSPTKASPERELDYVMMNTYLCNYCKNETNEHTLKLIEKIIKKNGTYINTFDIKKRSNTAIDHKKPVITNAWFIWWTEFINRLLDEDTNNYQLLCKECHIKITKKENTSRKKNK